MRVIPVVERVEYSREANQNDLQADPNQDEREHAASNREHGAILACLP